MNSILIRAETWLIVTTLTYFLMNGAQLFETLVVVPKWTKAPPASFGLLQEPYGLDLKRFWIAIHSLHEITFILAIIFCWQLPTVRTGLLILFGLHLAVRVWTLVYFAPAIITFQQLANQRLASPQLTEVTAPNVTLRQRVTTWRNLNYLRVAGFARFAAPLRRRYPAESLNSV